MTKFKRLICLFLVIALSASLFVGCGKSGNNSGNGSDGLVDMNITDDITLTYTYWEDHIIINELVAKFKEKYPNIEVKATEYDTGSYTSELMNLAAAGDLPDVFWLLECDFAISNGYLGDMSKLWEADQETENTIPSINKYKLGYFGTDQKWTTPVKYFPSTAFANKYLFERKGKEMPAMDMSWETFEKTVEDMTMPDDDGMPIYGVSEGCTVITWYPVAADPNCIGEFGWNGEEFDMENWAYGLTLEAKWANKLDYYSSYKSSNDIAIDTEIFGEEVFAQDRGNAAFRLDQWWCWERYWITDNFIENDVIWVPYVMPHTEANKESTNMMCIMDFGGLNQYTQYKREAYELLKYTTWGADGWRDKLELYPTLYTDDGSRLIEKNNMPICTDQDVWDGFRLVHPGEDDKYGRGPWFDYFIPYCQKAYAVPYGGQQIPGFTTWLEETGYRTIEEDVIQNGKNAYDYVDELERTGKAKNEERLKDIKELLQY